MAKAPSSTTDLFAGILDATSETEVDTNSAVEDVSAETETQDASANTQQALPSELDMLKQRARLMGITFSNSIGPDALRAKIDAKLTGEKDKSEETEEETSTETAETQAPVSEKVKVKSIRQQIYDREMRLLRLRITNLDPKKKDLPGEIFTVANEFLGAVRKFIPYGEATENGYHVPYVIYKQLKRREFLNIKTRKDSRGRTIVETGMAREFALEILPPLTAKELERLAAAQHAAAGGD